MRDQGIIYINDLQPNIEYEVHKTLHMPFLKIEYIKPRLLSHTFIYHTICISLCRIYYSNVVEYCMIDNNELINLKTNVKYPISLPKQYIYKNILDSKL